MNNQRKEAVSQRDPVTNYKKNYSTPTLQKYGEVKHLTAGGSGNAIESSQGQTKRT